MDLTRDQWALYLGGVAAVVLGGVLIWAPPASLAADQGLFGTAIAFITGGLAVTGVTVASTAIRRSAQGEEVRFVLWAGGLFAIAFGVALIWAAPSNLAGQAATFGSALAFIVGGAAALGVTYAAPRFRGLISSPGKRTVVYAGAVLIAVIGVGLLWFPPPGYTAQVAAGGGLTLITLALGAVGVTVSIRGA